MELIKGYIYSESLDVIVTIMVLVMIGWGCLGCLFVQLRKTHTWYKINILGFWLAIFIVFQSTILNRHVSARELQIIPFYSYYLARVQPEYYRVMLMNALLFEPLGLTLPFILGMQIQKKIELTIIFGCILSVCIEVIQYQLLLGIAEVDDIICNTIGCLIGTGAYFIMKRLSERRINYG